MSLHQTPWPGLAESRIGPGGDAVAGRKKIAWARANMPLVRGLDTMLTRLRPFAGLRIGMCLHLEPKTAVLIGALRAGGAEVVATGSPGTTDDDVAVALVQAGPLRIYSQRTDGAAEHRINLAAVLDSFPTLVVDNGADLVAGILQRHQADGVVGATEETTSGRLRYGLELQGRVPFPVLVINDSPLKQLIENQHGVGPTVVEGYMRATNCLVATRRFIVVGYGFCGRGIARSLRAAGAVVVVAEIDPVKALEAAFDGMLVTDLKSAIATADVVITATGQPGVVGRDELMALPDGVLLANAGHFSSEIDHLALAGMSMETAAIAPNIDEHRLRDGRRIRVLGGGEMLNLTAATGNQIQVMDLGFALQLRSLSLLAERSEQLVPGAQPVPSSVNESVAWDMLGTLSNVSGASRPALASATAE